MWRIIEKNGSAAISISVNIEEYEEVFNVLNHHAARSPYFFALCNMVSMVARYQNMMKLQEKIDFAFDRQEGQSA